MNLVIGWGFIFIVVAFSVFEVVMRIHEAYQVPL